MERRDFITIAKPPAEIFNDNSRGLQEGEHDAMQGQFFDRMEYPEEGGIFAYFYDHPFPTKGQPYPAAVEAIQAPKKLITGVARFAKRHWLLVSFVLILPSFLTKRIFQSLFQFFFIEHAIAAISPHILAEKKYCRMARELRRAGVVAIQKQSVDWQNYLRSGLESLVNIFEWDNAHRYRAQDALGELNKDAFSKNPSKEISRIIFIQVSRERGWHYERGRYVLVGKAIKLLLFFSPKFKKFAKDFVTELNLDEIKMDEADEYHNFLRPDYDIHDLPIEFRQKKYLKISGEYHQAHPERLKEGIQQREKLQAAAAVQFHIESEKGIPFLLFFAVPHEDKAYVKMVETKFSMERPALKESCLSILQGKGKPLGEFKNVKKENEHS